MLERFEVNRAGVRELLRSPAVLAALRRAGASVAAAAGDGHRVESSIGATRARVAVITATFPAMYREAKYRRLTRALVAGRGG